MLLPAWCGPFAPPAPGLAYGDPIGRLVTGTLIGRRLHKTLQQPWTHAVAALEIPAHAPCAQRQDMRGQIGTTHTGPNQKPTHVQDPLQMLAPLREVPSHPIVASLQAQRGTAQADASEPAMVGGYQIAPLSADQPALLQIMLAEHQFVPYPPMFLIGHLDQAQSADLLENLGNASRSGHRPVEPGRIPGMRPAIASLGKPPQTLVMQLLQRPACRGHLPVALAVLQIQTATNLSGQTPAAGSGIGAEQRGHQVHTFRKG